ncbi:tigger transposable element-derived protein 6-like [Ornithodoros turicata]|uniref:tigger transposable element-derived protein 6-like n=1 Tax=Ornithodoros turicata TaxID=34597 RepID=UPI00313A2FB3
MRARNVPLSGAVVQQKAKVRSSKAKCEDFKASAGWLQRFKGRHCIVGKVIAGEGASADFSGANSWLEDKLLHILARYESRDIYNADETGLFFKMLLNRTLTIKGDSCVGGKQSKQRLTVLLCVNMDGSDKRVPLVIGKSKRPHSFKDAKRLPVQYVSNSKAWMTRALFSDWLRELDRDMKRTGRKICLLLDNCSAHHVEGTKLDNVELQFFPANCTSKIQPLDQGIIHSVKCAYRHRQIERLLFNLHQKRDFKVEVLQAVQMLSAAWQATKVEVIVNCFRKAGIHRQEDRSCSDGVGAAVDSDEVLPPALVSAWRSLCTEKDIVPEDVTLEHFIRGDDSVTATEEFTDAAIIESVRGNADSDNDDDDTDPPLPTTSEVMDALDVLRRYACCTESNERAVNAIWVYNPLCRLSYGCPRRS